MKKHLFPGAWLLAACLTFLPAQDHSGVKQVNGRGIYCRAVGQGNPLVVVHGGPGLAHDYLFEPFSRLAAQRRLLFYDQMGSGLSDEFKPGEKVGMDDLVEELEGVRRAFGLGRIDLVGQSWGALIAVNYTARYPQNVRKLLLLEPAPGSSEYLPAFKDAIMERLSPEEKKEMAGYASDPALATDPALYRKLVNLSFKTYYFDPGKQDPDRLAYFDAPRIRKWRASSAMFGPYLADFDIYEALKSISCPVLIVHGDYDPIPTAAVERMARSLKDAELKIVKECGHFVHIEKPQEYFSTIEAFLDRK